ncbi:MAG: DNA-binding protein [Desulfotalea sp.]|nr:MAG: DNA-binding protein [Desulfotalea sp.]
MPRPTKPRYVSAYPVMAAFVPRGVKITGEVLMTVEEFEAIRLSDFEHLDQESAAIMMGVSRHTFGRLLAKARSTVANALVTGKELKITGGNYELRGMGCKRHMHRGGGRGNR